jgi:CRISPR-associated protein Cas5d
MKEIGSGPGTVLRVRLRGEKAVFCGPKKDEPVSYPAPTPSAARAMVEAIFWKPAIFWHIRRIWVLSPIKWFDVRVNELKTRGNGVDPVYIEDEREQRHILGLRDVDYVVEFFYSFTNRRGALDTPEKFIEMMTRRIELGQCHFQPYLGRRDYEGFFEPAPPVESLKAPPDLTGKSIDLGMMLLDRHYGTGNAEPDFFHAELSDGVLVEAGGKTLPLFKPANLVTA